MCVIGLNPSTADENTDDPTIRKCIGFARRLNCGGILMLNVGAYRATMPREWLKAKDPFGPHNTVTDLKSYISNHRVSLIVAAWGKNCAKYRPLSRALAIAHSIPNLMCWGRNNDGTPRHPLMLSYSTQLESLNRRHTNG
jgi:hypothetical protein